MTPTITDNDRDEITASLNGRQLRGWSYANDDQRRAKMRLAREFVEGWLMCAKMNAGAVQVGRAA